MNALEIKNLTKTFGDFTLNSLSLTLPKGCILGLIGENGAGKSTTIKLILGMLKADSGSITLLGEKDGAANTVLNHRCGCPNNLLLPTIKRKSIKKLKKKTASQYTTTQFLPSWTTS